MQAPGPPPGLWPPGAQPQGVNGIGQPNLNQQPQAQQTQSGASTSLLTIVRAQIVFLLSTLSEDNFNKNRDEIRSLIELHGPAPQQHLIRRLIQGAASLLSTSPASPPPSSASQPPSPELHLRLLASEVQRCARDPGLAERFRDAVLEGAEGPSGSDSVLRSFSLPTLLSHPSLAELSPLERLVFLTAFLTLLYPSTASSPAVSGLKRSLGLDAAKQIRQILPPALDQLGAPPSTVHDLAELSPLPISRLFSILLSDINLSDSPDSPSSSDAEPVFNEDERRAIVVAAVRGRLGPEVGAQALAHAFNEVAFDEKRAPSFVSALSRLAPVAALCTPDLARSVLAKFGNLPSSSSTSSSSQSSSLDNNEGNGGGGLELRVAAHLFDLIDLAQKEGDAGRGSIEQVVVSWVRAVHEQHPALRWGDVVRAYDSPIRAFPADVGGWGLRAFAALLQASPSPAPSSTAADDSRANPPQGAAPLISAPGGTAAVSGLWAQWANPLLQFSLLDRLIFLASSPTPPPATPASNGAIPAPPPPPPGTEPVLNLAALVTVHKVVSLEDAATSGPTIKQLAAHVQNSPWNAFEVVKTLVRLSGEATATQGVGGELGARVHELLDRGCKGNPELVLVALVQIEKPWNAVHTELTARLLSTFLAGHPSHQLVFLRLSQIDRPFLLAALRDFYAESEMNVTRILDIAQDLKALDQILELRPFVLALDLAALASRREYLNLDKWLTGQIKTSGNGAGAGAGANGQGQGQGGGLVRATLEFVGHKVQHELRRQELEHPPEPTTLALNAATIAVLMRVLRAHHELFTGNDVELFKEVRTQCLQLHPRLMNFSPKNTDSEPGMAVTSFSPEIESECDALYKRMYEQEISVDKVVSALRQAKESNNTHDHEFFACFLHGLFDEHRFFNTYPANELALTACLFGDLIQYHLIDFVPLGIAVRYVLDALRNPPDSNWFRFGIQALARFQSRLSEWPQLAHSILSIPHVQQLHPEVANTARQALMQRDGEPAANGGAPDGSGLGGTSGGDGGFGGALSTQRQEPQEPERLAFTAIHVEDAGGDPEAPDEATSDKILFIVNNLAPSNFDSKVKDMIDRIEPVHFAWFAHYLVAQRVSIEPNNHQLYQQFLDALKMPLLVKRVLYETFVKLATLLNSDKTVQSSTERTLLKNLGSWLGGLTLAKDKPIKQSNIAFKQLLIEGYDSNRLIVAIPFVCKVLEQCSKSRVFKPPNPWLMAILRLLVELYQFAELKLNLKFEIEVLCKSLDVDLKDVEPTEMLRNRPKELAAQAAAAAAAAQAAQQAQAAAQQSQQPGQPQPIPSSSVELALASLAAQQQSGRPLGHDLDGHDLRSGAPLGAAHHALPAAPGSAASADPSRLPPMLGVNQPGFSLSLQDTVSAALQNLPTHVVFNAQLPMFATNPALKRLICVAIDRAIREIIAPVVERSVTIAGISTRELTMKDFAMEGDESKMAGAAHLMVQNLAGSLALVTCKEPLRLSMVTHARTLLLQNGFTDESLPEQAILVIVGENLDLACSVVEKVAMEKAVLEVDEGLAPAYVSRRSHRERSREAFWDTAAMAASHYSGMLPDPLRLKLGGLSPSQLQVYEDFARLRVLPPADGRNGVVYADSPALSAAAAPQSAEPAVLSGPQAMEKFAALVAELDKALAAEESTALTGVAQESDLRKIIQQIPLVAASSSARDETALACSQKVVQLLYRSETTLARDAFVLLLDRLCALSTKVAKEVTAWLVYAEDERKFNVPVTVALLKARFINVADLDLQLAKFVMRDFRTSVVDFVAKLVSACLGEVPPVATREQFSNAFEALNQAKRQNKATEAARQLLQEVQNRGAVNVRNLSPGKLTSVEEPGVREQLTFCFAEWVRVYQQSFNVEKSFVDFVVQLQKQGILKGEEISSLFFRVCAEVSIDSYIKNKAAGGTPATGIFQPVDAFARLITFMIKYHADPTGANNDKAKVHYMTKVLSIVVLVLANSHEELGAHFQQKPFFRFFSSLLSNLASIETHLGPAYYQILVALSHSLNTLQPLFFPGFTFSWVALISHRQLMPKLLTSPDREGWTSFLRQLVSLFRFLAPFLRRAELSETTRTLYIGAQRILLVLLHDFPDFLSQAAYALGDAIPSSCTQLHNLILSAFPISTQLRLPDPLQPGLKLELLPEAQRSPAFLTDFTAALSAADLRAPLDQYLQSKEPSDILAMIKARIELAKPVGADEKDQQHVVKYNVPLINSLVLYLGVVAINLSKAQGESVRFDAQAESMKLLRQLIEEVDPEPRFYLISACANHLRYPNSHTLQFSSFILHAFGETSSDEVREQFLTVLLGRTMASRPNSFGTLYTFTQLLQSQHDQIVAVLDRLPADVRGVAPFASFISDLAVRTAATGAGAPAQGQQQQGQAQAGEVAAQA